MEKSSWDTSLARNSAPTLRNVGGNSSTNCEYVRSGLASAGPGSLSTAMTRFFRGKLSTESTLIDRFLVRLGGARVRFRGSATDWSVEWSLDRGGDGSPGDK